MGRSAEERAVIESWLRRIEWDGIYAAQEAFYISGMVAVDFSAWAKLRPPEHLSHLERWYKDVSTRFRRQPLAPSGATLRAPGV
jgi:hypothetical protein